VREARSEERFQRAAQFIFLNKCCWNGLYRVNSAGKFNVPYGRPRSDAIVDPANLVACSQALGHLGVELRVSDFAEALAEAEPGDLVYLDPPYVTGHNNNGFVDYNEVLFRWTDQVRLAEVARELAHVGVHVIVSNADHDAVLDLYRGFRKHVVERVSTLASNSTRRGRVSEVVLVAPPRFRSTR
jgi:DNA adenine methylase